MDNQSLSVNTRFKKKRSAKDIFCSSFLFIFSVSFIIVLTFFIFGYRGNLAKAISNVSAKNASYSRIDNTNNNSCCSCSCGDVSDSSCKSSCTSLQSCNDSSNHREYNKAIILEKDQRLYKIVWGDTLSQLAVSFKVPMQTLIDINHIKNPNLIYADDYLIVPKKSN